MCGVCGLISPKSNEKIIDVVQHMNDTLQHRGPDDTGIWSDTEAKVALGHRRLSIIDLNYTGAQPMISHCGRYIIVFNGEIYNHISLREELESVSKDRQWLGSSDTETLLMAITQWGLFSALKRIYGMFALALWDTQTQTLHLARDRMGEKPIYVAPYLEGWAFGSELKALLKLPGFKARLCRDAISSYLMYGYVPDTQCILQNVRKVPPGCVTSISLSGEVNQTHPFERFNDLVDQGISARVSNGASACNSVEGVLDHVIQEQMLSDVPLGCFLSGGIDSSLIAALMQKHSQKPAKTFAIGFREAKHNEAPHASAVARHIRTEHSEFIISEQDALNVVSELPEIYDEPFADSSQIPCVILCREVRNSVKVALTGDGGDEVFGGYNRHVIGPKLLSSMQKVPRSLLRIAGKFLLAFEPAIIRDNGWARSFAESANVPLTALDKAVKIAPRLGELNDLKALYEHFTQCMSDPMQIMLDSRKTRNHFPFFQLEGSEWMMAVDSTTYLPSDILVKVDRAAMAASLETRAPFLDARVISAAWELPLVEKISGGEGKKVLRSILYKYVPQNLVDRPKQGFAIPLDKWLRGDLRSWAETLLLDNQLFDLAGLNSNAVHLLWTRHQNRQTDHGGKLWTIFILLDWLRKYRHLLSD